MLTKPEIDKLIALVMMAMVDRHRFPDYASGGHDSPMARLVKTNEQLSVCEQESELDAVLAKLYAMRSVIG